MSELPDDMHIANLEQLVLRMARLMEFAKSVGTSIVPMEKLAAQAMDYLAREARTTPSILRQEASDEATDTRTKLWLGSLGFVRKKDSDKPRSRRRDAISDSWNMGK